MMRLPGCSTACNRVPAPPRTRPRWRPCARVSSSRMALASPWRRMPSTMPSSLHCIASVPIPKFADVLAAHYARTSALFLRKFEPHFAVALGVLAPAFAHLHEQEEMHGSLDHGGELAPGFGADRLDGLPALAEHDLALAFALDIDRLLDPDRAVLALRPRVGLAGGFIGKLLMQAQKELLARDLGRELAQRRVRDLI